MASPKGRRWMFTINNYSEGEVSDIQACAEANLVDPELGGYIGYLVYGREVGENGTPHLQGYMEFNKQVRRSWIVNNMVEWRGAWVDLAHSDPDTCDEYCKKDGDWWSCGTISTDRRKAGGLRGGKALKAKWDEVKDLVYQGLSYAQIRDTLPWVVQYPNAVREWVDHYEEEIYMKELKTEMDDSDLRPWQNRIVNILDMQNDRKLLWVVDVDGNNGKSWLSRWLEVNRGAIIFTGGKAGDIAQAFNKEPVVVFDLKRSVEEAVSYQAIESMKDGRLFKPKYGSKVLRWKGSKVVVFSNWLPKQDKMSADRWDIRLMEDLKKIPALVRAGCEVVCAQCRANNCNRH